MSELTPWQAGYYAWTFRTGETNPYKPMTSNAVAWAIGFADACEDEDQEANMVVAGHA